ncbi:hypothetical protein EW146_g6487 [Bondarzewia mesenterica]|uniref:BTB domain-containing protein n=1 Tax=Bondarzewia mesenterica TaxID=1095465 RepID=A0A4S4LP24_9AGAM|nr:hypothetical protein EW146_g6487 [Bondarzewia mesenterica]
MLSSSIPSSLPISLIGLFPQAVCSYDSMVDLKSLAGFFLRSLFEHLLRPATCSLGWVLEQGAAPGQVSLLELPHGASSEADQSPEDDSAKSGIRDFGPPFDDKDADIILRSSNHTKFRSSDHTDFWVYKNILAKASPFFRDMFSLPQLGAEPLDIKWAGVPVIPVEEEAITLGALLLLCYPVQDEFMRLSLDLSMLGSILRAARKYDMKCAYDAAHRMFVQSPLFMSHPAQAFGVAWRCRLEREVRAAARQCLYRVMSLETLGEDLKSIEGEGLFELFSYHKKCGKVANGLATNFAWIKRRNGSVWDWASANMWNQSETDDCQCSGTAIQVSDQNEKWHARSWWSMYMMYAGGELRDVPAGKSVTDSVQLASAIVGASSCAYCRERAPKALLDFSRIFAQEVERRVSQVRFSYRNHHLPFSPFRTHCACLHFHVQVELKITF